MKTLARGSRKHLIGWSFVGPVVLGTLLFNVAPILPAVWFSLTDWSGMTKASFLGLANYIDLFTDDLFYATLNRTFIYMFGTVVLGYAAGLTLALLVNRSVNGIRFFRTIYFAPVVTSSVAVGMTWRWILNTQYGVFNSILGSFGVLGPRWLGEPSLAMLSVIVVAVWKGMGYTMIILLAGLQGIPDSLYESADIDGASRLQKFVRITFPLLSPISFFVMVLSVIGAFRSFDIIYIMTGGGPGFATSVYVFRLWQEAFHYFKMGYASAMAWVLFVIVGVITVTQTLQKRSLSSIYAAGCRAARYCRKVRLVASLPLIVSRSFP